MKMVKGLIGRKVGMTQVFDDQGNHVPVTVVEAGPCVVVGHRNQARDGYEAVQIGLVEHLSAKKISKPRRGQFEKHDLPPESIELQMLYGMADQLKGAAIERGLRLREYVPVGEMIPGMAYLVRRLLENTSNESWLRAGFRDSADTDELLASPHRTYADGDPGVRRIQEAPERHRLLVREAAGERPPRRRPDPSSGGAGLAGLPGMGARGLRASRQGGLPGALGRGKTTLAAPPLLAGLQGGRGRPHYRP